MQERFDDIKEIYDQLEINEKYMALVNKSNVQELITRAIENGNKKLEQKLREWS